VIAAIMLTLRERPGMKHQSASQQVAVQAKDRIRIVKMASVVKAPVVAPTEVKP
jgi:NADH-quinone oxidoreductase subunit J